MKSYYMSLWSQLCTFCNTPFHISTNKGYILIYMAYYGFAEYAKQKQKNNFIFINQSCDKSITIKTTK